MASLHDVIALLYRADWTRLALSATVHVESDPDLLLSRMRARIPFGSRAVAQLQVSQSDRAALLIGLDGRYRLEHAGADGLIQGNDGQGPWLWWRSGPSGRSPFEARLSGERPVPVLFCPQDLLDRHVLEVLGPVTASGRDAIAVTATPRAGGQLYDRVEAAVDAELGIVLRRAETFEGQLVTLTELTDVTMNPPEAADQARYPGPPGSRHPEEPGESVRNGKANVVLDLAAGGLGALVKHAPRRPGQRTDPEPAEVAMPSPDPEPLAAADGSPSDDLLYLLYRSGEPHDLTATMHEWRDTAVMNAQFTQTIREAGVGGGGLGSLLDAIPTGTTRTDARLRISAAGRYRVDYTGRDDGNAPQTVACDGEHRWHFYKDRILTGPAGPLREPVAYLVDPTWLLRRHLSAPRDITYRGRPAHQFRVTRGTGGLGETGPLMFFPADAIVDAETGCLLRLISFAGDAPAAWWELDDISTEPGDPDAFRVTIPPGAHVIEATGNPFTDWAAVMPGRAGTAARTATDAVRRTHSAVSAARTFLDDLRGQR